MTTREIFSFVHKFQQLRSAGYSAHLDIDAHVGKAWVGLRLQLEHDPCPSYQPAYQQKQFSTSRYRRRERRAAARAANNHAEEASETETSTNNEIANTPEIGINEIAEENENQSIKSKEIEAEEAPVVESEVETENNTFIDAGNENNEVVANIEPLRENVVPIEEKNVDDEALAAPCPDVIAVYAIATLENCPDAQLDDDYGASIRRFLTSEQHLDQNVASVDLHHLSSRSFRNNTHTHIVSVTMNVKTARLWENPASYVRKHLGLANYWERSNGTIVKLSRIHQK